MQLIPAKSDSTAGANGQLPAAEWNDRNVEEEKVITRSGQTLNPAITDQFSKAIFINAIGAEAAVDSGSGNTITLTVQTGGSGLVPPDDYAHFDGGTVCFNKTTANTGTAVTVAAFGLAAKSLVRKDLSLPVAGDVVGRCFVKWDNAGDRWLLLRNETDTYKFFIAASGAVAPAFANNEIEVDLSVGNVSISQMPVPDFIGQRVHIFGVGSGIGDIAGGTGLYVNGVFFTENTGGVFLTAISATEWRAENGVTADYVSGVYRLLYTGSGRFKNTGTVSKNNASTGAQTFTFPVSLFATPEISQEQIAASATLISVDTVNSTSFDLVVRAMSDGALSSAARNSSIIVEGKY